MLVGILVNKKSYDVKEYIEALVITFGVALFTFTEKSGPSKNGGVDTSWGIFLVGMYLLVSYFYNTLSLSPSPSSTYII